jgi:hypothetical protein
MVNNSGTLQRACNKRISNDFAYLRRPFFRGVDSIDSFYYGFQTYTLEERAAIDRRVLELLAIGGIETILKQS